MIRMWTNENVRTNSLPEESEQYQFFDYCDHREQRDYDHYKKPINSGQYLNFLSNHPLKHKKSVIFGLFDRVLLLSHPRFRIKNLEEFIRILINNGYPLKFIFFTINNRIQQFETNGIKERDKIHPVNQLFFTVPYVNGISKRFKNLTKKHNFNLFFLTTNSIQKYIKTGKDQLNPLSCCGAIYKINCNCKASYVEQTKRSVKTRINEHFRDINKSSGSSSVISDHRLTPKHDFDWQGVRILDRESSWQKISVSEMIHIKRQKQGINKQSDTDLLPDNYLPVIRSLSPS